MQEAIDTLLELSDIRMNARIRILHEGTVDEGMIGEFRGLVQRLSTEFSAAIQEGATGNTLRNMANLYSGLERDLRAESESFKSFQRLYEGLQEHDMEIGYPLQQFEQLCRAYFTLERDGSEFITLPQFDWHNMRFTYDNHKWNVLSE